MNISETSTSLCPILANSLSKNEEVANLKINGVLSKNQNIEYILITLKNIENINYQIKGNKIYIK